MIAQMQQATENKTTLAQIVNPSSARRPIFKPIAVDLDLDSTHAQEREQYTNIVTPTLDLNTFGNTCVNQGKIIE